MKARILTIFLFYCVHLKSQNYYGGGGRLGYKYSGMFIEGTIGSRIAVKESLLVGTYLPGAHERG